MTYKEGCNEITSWVIEHMIKNDEDIYLIKKYMPIPLLDKKQAEKDYDQLGDGGILRTFVIGKQGGCGRTHVSCMGLSK